MALDGVFREHWARVLATLVGILGDVLEEAGQRMTTTRGNGQ